MKGTLIGCSTVDIQGLPLMLVIPDESISDLFQLEQLISSPRRTSFGTRLMHHVRPQRPTNAWDLHSQVREPLLLFLSGVE
jgi:hypothetical protein